RPVSGSSAAGIPRVTRKMTARALSILFACTLMFAAEPLAAQQGDAQQPRFRSSVAGASGAAAVVDRRGRPLASRAPAEFSVRIDGKARRVASAEWVPLTTSSA